MVSDSDLRSLAREATTRFLGGEGSLTNCVAKVASACTHTLTAEHVRRVCEMSYHDTFEREWRKQAGGSRFVSFDPPCAKEAARLYCVQKTAAAQLARNTVTGSPVLDKIASAPVPYVPEPPPIRNAFQSAMSISPVDRELGVREALHTLKTASRDVREAITQLETEIGSSKTAELYAHPALGRQARQACLDGATPGQALAVCEHFLKEAQDIPEEIAVDVLTHLVEDMIIGEVFPEKTALAAPPNPQHPLNRLVVKVAHVRLGRLQREIALDDLRTDQTRLEKELSSELYRLGA